MDMRHESCAEALSTLPRRVSEPGTGIHLQSRSEPRRRLHLCV